MSVQTSPRNYTEAERSGAFRNELPPSEWQFTEIVQIDLPSGYRCHVITRLSEYELSNGRFYAHSTYLGRRVRFVQSSVVVDGEPLEDWKPVDARGNRIRLIVPSIEMKILRNRGRYTIDLEGDGILRGRIGYGGDNNSALTVRKEIYTKCTDLRDLITAHWQRQLGINWKSQGAQLIAAVKQVHDQIIDQQLRAEW